MVHVEVQLDDLTGDAISGRGTGNLLITSGTSAPLTLQGRYDIKEGDYLFTFQSVLGKKFKLNKNTNNYIAWDGDPYEATIHIDAIYTAEDVSFAPLANSGFSDALKTIRDDVDVYVTMTGSLFHPDFKFDLGFPTSRPVYSSPDFQFAYQQMKKNENELNKQVTYLIVFNTFAPFENTPNTGGINPWGEFTYNTISGLLFGKVNEQLNKILSGLLPNNNLTLNFTGSLYNRNLLNENKGFQLPTSGNVNISLGVPLFNNRVNVQFGGTLDVPLAGDIQQTVRIYPDITIEFLINQTGTLRANIFYRQNIDFLTGTAPGSIVPRRYGASVGYGKEFDVLSDLFGGNKAGRTKKKDTASEAKTDSTKSNIP
jgi:hypothetical protein